MNAQTDTRGRHAAGPVDAEVSWSISYGGDDRDGMAAALSKMLTYVVRLDPTDTVEQPYTEGIGYDVVVQSVDVDARTVTVRDWFAKDSEARGPLHVVDLDGITHVTVY